VVRMTRPLSPTATQAETVGQLMPLIPMAEVSSVHEPPPLDVVSIGPDCPAAKHTVVDGQLTELSAWPFGLGDFQVHVPPPGGTLAVAVDLVPLGARVFAPDGPLDDGFEECE